MVVFFLSYAAGNWDKVIFLGLKCTILLLYTWEKKYLTINIVITKIWTQREDNDVWVSVYASKSLMMIYWLLLKSRFLAKTKKGFLYIFVTMGSQLIIFHPVWLFMWFLNNPHTRHLNIFGWLYNWWWCLQNEHRTWWCDTYPMCIFCKKIRSKFRIPVQMCIQIRFKNNIFVLILKHFQK